jgi:hypothetical protein
LYFHTTDPDPSTHTSVEAVFRKTGLLKSVSKNDIPINLPGILDVGLEDVGPLLVVAKTVSFRE